MRQTQTARVRINLSAGELEIEGREDFVSQYADSIRDLLGRIVSDAPGVYIGGATSLPPTAPNSPQPRTLGTTSSELEPFGEVLHSLGSKTGTDQILLAGYYVSADHADGTFSTIEANKLLIEQGIKLSNASQSLKNNLTSKRVFKVSNRYKVAKSGIEYLKSVGVRA